MTQRAMGRAAQLLAKTESVYGTAPSGNWLKLPFSGADYGAEQKLLKDDTLTGSREELDPSHDVINVQHQCDLPIDLNNIGQWLFWLFGADSAAGSSNVTHTFNSGNTTLVSFSKEVGLTDIGQYFLATGCAVDSMEFNLRPSGLMSVTVKIIGQNEAQAGTSGGGTPTSYSYTRFSPFQGFAQIGGTSIAGITDARFTITNGLEGGRVVRNDGLIEGIDLGMMEVSGTVTLRFETTTPETILADADSYTPVVLAMGWQIGTTQSLTIDINRAWFERPKTNVKGPGGVSMTFPFQGSHDTNTGYLVQAVLKNQQAQYA